MEYADVVIVGAGLSGLAAARSLQRTSAETGQGFSVIMIEARERVGGRTETKTCILPGDGKSRNAFSPVDIDIGGQWIGPHHSRLLGLVKEFDLELIAQTYPTLNGSRSSPSIETQGLVECVGYRNRDIDAAAKEEVNAFMDLLEKLLSAMDVETPWLHPKANELDAISTKDFINECEFISRSESKREVALFLLAMMASPLEDVSMLFTVFFLKSSGGIEAIGDGENGAQKWRVRGGTQQISEYLLSSLLKEQSLLGTETDRDQSDDETGLTSPPSSRRSSVSDDSSALSETKDRFESEIDSSVSSALSVSNSKSSFKGVSCMDRDLLNSLRGDTLWNFSMHSSDPVIAINYFNDSGSNDDPLNYTTVTCFSGKMIRCKKVIIALSPRLAISAINFNPPLAPEKVQLYESFCHGQAIKIVMAFQEAFWLKGCLPTETTELAVSKCQEHINENKHFLELGPISNMFDSEVRCSDDWQSQDKAYPALVAFICGNDAQQMRSLCVEDRRLIVLKQLRHMYCECDTCHVSRTSNEENDEEPISDLHLHHQKFQPLLFLEKVWADEKYSGGCFAGLMRPTPDSSFVRLAAQHFRTPSNGKIYWASTEMATNFYGFMEGAIRSGERAAQEVMADIQVE